MLGSRSVVIFVKLTNPSTKTSTTATSTVYGFFTLYFDISFSFAQVCAAGLSSNAPDLSLVRNGSDRPVGRKACSSIARRICQCNQKSVNKL